MSLAPPDTRADIDILEELDFEADVPCETTEAWHAHFGTGPAVWLTRSVCPKCACTEIVAMCQGCWDSIVTCPHFLQCNRCKWFGRPMEWVSIIGPIK